jgi:hypothetical protein
MSRQELGEQSEGPVAYPPGDWDFVVTVPADCEDSYSTVVPTLADSTVSAGMHYTVFFVRARTSTPGTYFDAPPDSGYSLDNLAPSAPSGLHMPAPTELSWSECPDEDFDYFSVYGSGSPAHDSAAVLIGCTVESAMDVTSHGYGYYHVTATDFAGNEGEASSIDNPSAGVPGAEDTPASYALKQISPNPFEATTSIAFDLPTPAQISLKILDVEGRLVRTVGQGLWPAGSHSVTWSGLGENGSPVGAGVYFVRMETAGFKAAKKVLLMR